MRRRAVSTMVKTRSFFLLIVLSLPAFAFCCDESDRNCLTKAKLMKLVMSHDRFGSVIGQANWGKDGIILRKNDFTDCLDSKDGLFPVVKNLETIMQENNGVYISIADFSVIGNNARIQIYYPPKDTTLSFGFEKFDTGWEIVTVFADEG